MVAIANLPTTNEMPSLDHLSRDRLAARMVDRMTGDRGRPFEDMALMTNFARLVDRSIIRYEEASIFLDEWIATRHQGYFSSLFRGVSAAEECISLVHRAVRYADILMVRGVVDPTQMPASTDREAIKEMRDAIQHTEDRILGTHKPPISEGEPNFPSFGDIGIELGSQSLDYRVLSRTITALHETVGYR